MVLQSDSTVISFASVQLVKKITALGRRLEKPVVVQRRIVDRWQVGFEILERVLWMVGEPFDDRVGFVLGSGKALQVVSDEPHRARGSQQGWWKDYVVL